MNTKQVFLQKLRATASQYGIDVIDAFTQTGSKLSDPPIPFTQFVIQISDAEIEAAARAFGDSK